MTFILPPPQASVKEKLFKQLADSTGPRLENSISELIQNYKEKKQGKALGELLGSPKIAELSPEAQISLAKTLGMGQSQGEVLSPSELIKKISVIKGGKPGRPSEEFEEEVEEFTPYSAEQLLTAEKSQKGASKILQESEKAEKAKFEEKKEKDRLQEALNRSFQILKKGATGYTPKALTPKGREERAELNTLAEIFASRFVKELNKGNLPQSRFKYLMGLLPKSTDTDRALKGKLKALSQIFELELPSSKKKEESKLKRVEKGTKIDEETVDRLIKDAKGDWKKAEEMARKMGYDV